MVNFSGKYNFKTQAHKPIKIAFLYSKLTETDEAFSFTSPIKSWRRMKPLYPVNPLASQSFYCHEMPDNCGNYASLSDCLIRKLDSKFAPQSGSDAGANNNLADSVVALFTIGDDSGNSAYDQGFNIFNLLQNFSTTLKAGFWADYGSINVGMRATVPTESAILFNGITIPANLMGSFIGYDVSARKWNSLAFAESGDIFYFPKTTTGINSEETLEYYGEDRTDRNFNLDSLGAFVAHTATSIVCNSNIEDEDWYVSGAGNLSGSVMEQQIGSGSRAQLGRGYVVFRGYKNQLSDFAALLNQAASYWDLDSGVVLQVVANPFGCSTTGDLNGGGLPDDPDPDVIPPVTSASYFGRYSEIFVNIQSGGETKELKLPIRFPTRATKVQYGDAGFYNKNITPTSGQQPVVAQWTSELFKGVIELDADFIYAKILYAPFREWKAGEKPFAKPANSESNYGHNQNEWTIESRKLTYQQASDSYLDATDGIVPQVDWFSKCRIFKIRQSDMEIVEDATYSRGQNQAISQDGWTHEITKDYVLLDHRTEVKYMLNLNRNDTLIPPDLIVPPTTGKRGYCGTPIVYPQIGLGVDDRARYRLPPYTFPDFLTPQEFWTDLDWIIYLLSEKPANHFVDWTERLGYQDILKNLYFETPGKFSGYGRTPNHQASDYPVNIRYYNTDYTDIESGYGFMDKIVEYNCFLGSAIVKNGLIEKWVRVSPNSFPIPKIRRVQ